MGLFEMQQPIAPKFEFTGETKKIDRRTLRRIRALRAIPRYSIEPGDLGGWLQEPENLDHFGAAWVCGEAMVMDAARVTMNGLATGSAVLHDYAQVMGGRVMGRAQISGRAIIGHGAEISGNAQISGSSTIRGPMILTGNVTMAGGQIKMANDQGHAILVENEAIHAEANRLRARLAGYENLKVITEFSTGIARGWGPTEGDLVPVPAPSAQSLAAILDELQELRELRRLVLKQLATNAAENTAAIVGLDRATRPDGSVWAKFASGGILTATGKEGDLRAIMEEALERLKQDDD